MSRTKAPEPNIPDFTRLLSDGFFSKIVPDSLIDEVLAKNGRESQRVRLIPAPAIVHLIMAMSLYREPPVEEILEILLDSFNAMSGGRSTAFKAPSKSSISEARSKLGFEPMRMIADSVLKPIAPHGFPGAWYRGMRLMAFDGTCFNLPDEKRNIDYFGYPSVSRGEPAFPQARVVSLVETGTKAVTAAEIGVCGTSEQTLTSTLIERGKLAPDMLVLADRNFVGYPLWSKAVSLTEAKLLWRCKIGLKLPIQENLPDGSFLSFIRDSRNRNLPSLPVRIVEYILRDEESPPEADPIGQVKYRLLTNIFDHKEAPAAELAALYHERWEIENMYGELKKSLCHGFLTLRSKTPELVLQELWGMILFHYSLRTVMAESTMRYGVKPNKLSFIKCVRILRRKLPLVAASPPRRN